jgi:hypothetical protein
METAFKANINRIWSALIPPISAFIATSTALLQISDVWVPQIGLFFQVLHPRFQEF